MRLAPVFFFGAALFLAQADAQDQGSLTDTNFFDLEVSLDASFIPGELSMLITVRPEYPFNLSTATAGVERGISGVLHWRHGKVLLDLTAVGPGWSSAAKGLELELDKPIVGGGYGSGVSYLSVIRVQRHKSRLPPTNLPNKPMQPSPR